MDKETKFLNAARRVLDEAEKNLDSATVQRLPARRALARDAGGIEIFLGLVEHAPGGVQKFCLFIHNQFVGFLMPLTLSPSRKGEGIKNSPPAVRAAREPRASNAS